MRPVISFVGSLFAVLAFAASAWAHPGHGSTDAQTLMHLAEPMHLLAWLAPIALTAIAAAKLARRSS